VKTLKPLSERIKEASLGPVSYYYTKIRSDLLADALTVFVFHDVSDEPSEFSRKHHLNVPPALFDYQIGFIKSVFNIISPDDLLNLKIPPRAAMVSFDDGFRSVFTNALPILRQHEVPSIVFLNMGPIKGERFWSGLITYLCDKYPEFLRFLEQKTGYLDSGVHPYLFCSRNIVNAYLKVTGLDLREQVSGYVGPFADMHDLSQVADHPLIFFGNHLLNHYVPILMPDDELWSSFICNFNELKRFSNSRNVFSFPFGQPRTCFTEKQVKFLLDRGVKQIFSSSGKINYDVTSPLLDRILLDASHDSPDKIWYQVFRERLAHCPRRILRIGSDLLRKR